VVWRGQAAELPLTTEATERGWTVVAAEVSVSTRDSLRKSILEAGGGVIDELEAARVEAAGC
jgi:hypothetical protein